MHGVKGSPSAGGHQVKGVKGSPSARGHTSTGVKGHQVQGVTKYRG